MFKHGYLYLRDKYNRHDYELTEADVLSSEEAFLFAVAETVAGSGAGSFCEVRGTLGARTGRSGDLTVSNSSNRTVPLDFRPNQPAHMDPGECLYKDT
mgnify:CR=1 FL=1